MGVDCGKFFDRKTLLHYGIGVITFIVTGTTAWNTMDWKLRVADTKADQAMEATKDNRKVLEGVKKDIGDIKTEQRVIQNKLDYERARQEEYRKETKEDLSRIMRILEGNRR